MQITRGRIPKPAKILIYGPEGIGKTTLASCFPEPLFIDTEGSTAYLDVARLPAPSSWAQLISEVEYVRDNPDVCKTLVIDTADWAEQLCINDVCAKKKVDGIEGIGYGKGYVYVKESFGKLLNLLNDVIDRGIHVVITAHAQMRKFEQPDELGAYDRWELKMEKKTAPMVKEWADAVLFCNYKTMVVNVDGQGAQKGKNKVQGGRRVMYTSHHACWDAKNRFGLPDELNMDYEEIRNAIETGTDAAAKKPANAENPKLKTQTSHEQKESKKATSDKPKEPPQTTDQMRLEDLISDDDPVQNARHMTDKQAVGELETVKTRAPDDTKPAAVSRYFSDSQKIPKALRDLMEQDDINEWDIQTAVAAKGYYTVDTLLENMDPEFINGWVIAFWPQVKGLIAQIREKEEIPFN